MWVWVAVSLCSVAYKCSAARAIPSSRSID